MNSRRQFVSILLVIIVLVMCPKAQASMQEARRLLSLTETIEKTDCEVVYDGNHYSCKFVGRFARAFLVTHYKGETAEKWIDKWCSVSRGGRIIWVKERKQYTIAKKRLKEELKNQHD